MKRDAFGTPVGTGDVVAPIGDPTRPVLVTGLTPGGLLRVRHAGDDYQLRAHLVRVVTVRDAVGAPLAPGDIVRPLHQVVDETDDAATRVVDAVLYGVGLLTLADPDGDRPLATLPALWVRVGTAVDVGDEVVDQGGTLYVVRAAYPDLLDVETVYSAVRAQLRRAAVRRVVPLTHGVLTAGDGRWVVPALGDDPALIADIDRIITGRSPFDNVVPLPRAAV